MVSKKKILAIVLASTGVVLLVLVIYAVYHNYNKEEDNQQIKESQQTTRPDQLSENDDASDDYSSQLSISDDASKESIQSQQSREDPDIRRIQQTNKYPLWDRSFGDPQTQETNQPVQFNTLHHEFQPDSYQIKDTGSVFIPGLEEFKTKHDDTSQDSAKFQPSIEATTVRHLPNSDNSNDATNDTSQQLGVAPYDIRSDAEITPSSDANNESSFHSCHTTVSNSASNDTSSQQKDAETNDTPSDAKMSDQFGVANNEYDSAHTTESVNAPTIPLRNTAHVSDLSKKTDLVNQDTQEPGLIPQVQEPQPENAASGQTRDDLIPPTEQQTEANEITADQSQDDQAEITPENLSDNQSGPLPADSINAKSSDLPPNTNIQNQNTREPGEIVPEVQKHQTSDAASEETIPELSAPIKQQTQDSLITQDQRQEGQAETTPEHFGNDQLVPLTADSDNPKLSGLPPNTVLEDPDTHRQGFIPGVQEPQTSDAASGQTRDELITPFEQQSPLSQITEDQSQDGQAATASKNLGDNQSFSLTAF